MRRMVWYEWYHGLKCLSDVLDSTEINTKEIELDCVKIYSPRYGGRVLTNNG